MSKPKVRSKPKHKVIKQTTPPAFYSIDASNRPKTYDQQLADGFNAVNPDYH